MGKRVRGKKEGKCRGGGELFQDHPGHGAPRRPAAPRLVDASGPRQRPASRVPAVPMRLTRRDNTWLCASERVSEMPGRGVTLHTHTPSAGEGPGSGGFAILCVCSASGLGFGGVGSVRGKIAQLHFRNPKNQAKCVFPIAFKTRRTERLKSFSGPINVGNMWNHVLPTSNSVSKIYVPEINSKINWRNATFHWFFSPVWIRARWKRRYAIEVLAMRKHVVFSIRHEARWEGLDATPRHAVRCKFRQGE